MARLKRSSASTVARLDAEWQIMSGQQSSTPGFGKAGEEFIKLNFLEEIGCGDRI
jgi:hypothetical protein